MAKPIVFRIYWHEATSPIQNIRWVIKQPDGSLIYMDCLAGWKVGGRDFILKSKIIF